MQLRRAKWLGLVVVGGATAIVACSSSTIVDGGGAFGRAGGVGPSGSASASGPAEAPRCPGNPPTVGTNCGGFGTYCTYGPELRDECTEKYECNSGYRWEDATGECQVQCPKTFADVAVGTACGDRTMTCSYDEGTCGCVGDGPAPDAGAFDSGVAGDAGDAGDGGKDGGFTKPLVPGVWKCVAPPTDVICPSARPRVLDACVKEVTCDYGSCELGRDLSYRCSGTYWAETPPADCDE